MGQTGAADSKEGFLSAEDARRVIHDMTYVDPVTGDQNVQVLEEFLEGFLSRLRAGVTKGTWDIVCFNIRRFKVYNSRNGFAAGNQLLRDMNALIRKTIGSRHVARNNGDHFYALIEEEGAEKAVRAVHDGMKKAGVHVYAGIYTITGDETDTRSVLDYSKLAAGYAADDFTDYFRRFGDDMLAEQKLRSYLVNHVDEAVEKGYIKVYYQPVVGTLSHRISSVEALSRWIDPEYGFLAPDRFIDVLENARLLYKIDLYVVEKVCQWIHAAMTTDRTYCRVSVNLSRHDLDIEDLHGRINDILEKYEVPHEAVHFEITESALVRREDTIKEHIRRFHEDGYEVWLDDFGSGYSSLNTLQNFDFDCLKIDMLFLRSRNERTPVLMRSIVDMAKRLGMLTLTEGVETEEELHFLRKLGCTYAQGYLFSKPVPAKELFSQTGVSSLGIETDADSIFYRQAGRTNVLAGDYSQHDEETEIPQMIAETDDDGSQTILYISETGRDFFRRILGTRVDKVPYLLSTGDTAPMDVLDTLEKRASCTGHQVSYDFISGTELGRVLVRSIAEYDGRHAFLVRIQNISAFENSSLAGLQTVTDVYSMFEQVDEVIPAEDTYRHIYGEMDDARSVERMKASEVYAYLSNEVVHPAERERYLRFTDMATLERRVESAPSRSLNAFFHLRQADGKYEWRRMVIRKSRKVSRSGEYMICVSSNTVGWDDQRIRSGEERQDLPADISHDSWPGDAFSKDVLWEAIVSLPKLGIFWKDKDRRFAGVSDAFLRYYGLTLPDVIGKNDEDMMWHPDPEPFRQDELRVLREGAVINDAIGECLADGKVRRIMATKAPVRKGGEIIGLIGYFVDITDAAEMYQVYQSEALIDPETGLLNAGGFSAGREYFKDHFLQDKGEFGYIVIQLRNLKRYHDFFGASAYTKLMKKLGTVLQAVVAERGIIGHIAEGRFAVLTICRDEKDFHETEAKLVKNLKSVRTADGTTPFTPYFDVGSCMHGPGMSIGDMVLAAESRLQESAHAKKSGAYSISEISELMQEYRRDFEYVRLVDPEVNRMMSIDDEGRLEQSDYVCYAFLDKEHACENCISARTVHDHCDYEKIEIRKGIVLRVFSMYVEVDGKPLSLECVKEIGHA